jgi:hypothetical protein
MYCSNEEWCVKGFGLEGAYWGSALVKKYRKKKEPIAIATILKRAEDLPF